MSSDPTRDPLLTLLEQAELAPPERLPAITLAAGRAIGARITIHLVDFDQRHLHSLTPADDAAPLGVDTTLAGRAFRQVRTLPSAAADRPRLWVPLLDGVERLGVLEVEVPDVADLHDPDLLVQCRRISMLLGHLVVLTSQYGDALDLVRLRRPRTAAGELIWSLLPPLTAGVDGFVVTGVLEPCYDVGGDAFDYSLSETTATLLLMDAVGHDLRSGLVAATALAAHRSARHAGLGLREQAVLIDEMISRQFSPGTFVTAVLAEVDLGSGRLRYLNAGHPHPLVMRGGKIVRSLTGGHRVPLGLGPRELTVAEEMLQPDDWLVMHTDGITEARDEAGEFFGDARLVDFLRREAAAGHPPPETARRLVHAVLDHQDGKLQDDATVLLARWTSRRELLP
ncbi:PP2C family protein-serine/threonine phosphatase [Actinophytocola oryzae]|uniref:Stage II sporulation protein E n=1 Tax=Actinophytocola oryzae TaxID=502181 RepID=A0A4R7VHT6_9PSEU|nr:PP2C family protein-serine/threonine phosphatase [Actinophytocola oryzae]TDV48725.1 stage II sporulation protein E [Actinophytocola oryzae]